MKIQSSTKIDDYLNWRLFVVTGVAMFVAGVFSLISTLAVFEQQMRPFLVSKNESVALKVRNDIEYAISVGVPFEKLRGIEEFVDELTKIHPEVRTIEVRKGPAPAIASVPQANNNQGFIPTQWISGLETFLDLIAGKHNVKDSASVNINDGANIAGYVISYVNEDYVAEQLKNLFFDTLVILIAVTLVALEIIVVLTGFRIAEPLRKAEYAIHLRASGDLGQYDMPSANSLTGKFVRRLNLANTKLYERALSVKKAGGHAVTSVIDQFKLDRPRISGVASIIDARIPLFIFCVAEELQKSFLPLFVAEYYQPTDFFDKSIMVGLPISVFMFVIAAITPFAGRLVDQFGNRRLFLVGLAPALLGYFGCYFAQNADQIVLARGTTAIGYAIITISAQSYIAAILTKENRARGMATFVGVLMAATMCGTAIGGILAEWLGYKAVFLVSIALSSLAGILGYVMLSRKLETPAVTKAQRSTSAFSLLLSNTRFITIILFCAIPAKIILTGFLYLYVPIYLSSLDTTQSEIGRIMMLYSLIIIPISPIAARFSDHLDKNLGVVIGATIASGIVLLGMYQSASVAVTLSVVAAMGVVHSFIKAPLIVAAMDAAEASGNITRTNALSLLRTSERIGSVAGPVIVATMLVYFDYQTTAALLGIAIATLGLMMAVISMRGERTGAINV